MSTLNSLASELKSWFSDIDPLACPVLVRRALKDIFDSRDWSFNKRNGSWYAPDQITAGTVTTTRFSTTVTPDAAAQAAWAGIISPTAPQSPITLRQFRVNGGPVYNISAVAALAASITLDRPYTEKGSVGISYSVYQPYMPAPAVDFKRWMSVVDPISGYRFRYENLFRTQKELDKRDPQRTGFGWPTWIVPRDYVTISGLVYPRFELGLGHPIQAVGYILEYQVNGDGLSATATLPAQVSDQTILARARYYAHDLVSNQPNVDIKIKMFHTAKMRTIEAQYVDLLRGDQRGDNAIFDSQVTDERHGPDLNGPLDADFMQSHVLSWID